MRNKDYKITNINIKGFKSIDSEGQNIPLEDINVFIGANGVGKSNLISFFEMFKSISDINFQKYISINGFSNSILHYGSTKTSKIELLIELRSNSHVVTYGTKLIQAVRDTLVFSDEFITESNNKLPIVDLPNINYGNKESGLFCISNLNDQVDVKKLLIDDLRIFQFNDTSKDSKIRNSIYINDGRKLHSDGGNLAAFLYTMKNQKENNKYYQRIVKYIKMVMPQFNDFELLPDAVNTDIIRLDWHETSSEYLFGPHQISDGSLRFMALASLLLQPPKSLPALIVLDEPELGLHPTAISLLASMVKTASQHCQVIIATQSTTLIDEFEAKDIVVVEREKERSVFKKLDLPELEEWMQRYSLSEIWEKNIIGGRP